MNGSIPLSVRVYETLLRRLVPSLGNDYAGEAAATFQALGRDARERGGVDFIRFCIRETRSLLSVAILEARVMRRDRRARKAEAACRAETGGQLGGGGTGQLSPSIRPPGPRHPGPRLPGMHRALDAMLLDLRYAVRNLVRTPGFMVVTVLSLTFGIAASTVLFSVANAVFIRPLPHAEDPEALVRIFSGTQPTSRGPLAFPDFLDLREATQTLTGVAVARDRNFYVGSAAEASRRIWGQQVSENYFDVLGIPMARGRGFLPEDIEAGGQVAIIGHNLWQQRFAGDPGVLGRELLVDGRPYTIIGVGPPGMVSLGAPLLLEVAIPTVEGRDERGHRAYTAVARLGDGVTLAQAQAELDAFALHMAEAYPEDWARSEAPPRGLSVLTPRQAMVPAHHNSAFWMAAAGFLAAVGLILLVTCSNVANLLLTRAFERRQEIAVRSAIGARTRRILGQLLTENLILFGLAGVVSLLLIRGMVSVINAGWSFLPPLGVNFEVDGRVLAFAFGLTLVAGLTFGLLPAVQAARPDLVPALKGRSVPLRFRRFGFRNLLVGAQVGGSAVFVMVTLLLVQSLSQAGKLDLGFDPEGVAIISVNLAHRDYGEEEGRQFLSAFKARVEGMSGVEGAEISTWIPLEGGGTYLGGLEPEGYSPDRGESAMAGMTVVSPGYLDLLGVTVLRGRSLLPEDDGGGERVALASQAFVDRYWPGESGVGKVIRRGDLAPILVVGVVVDVPMRSLAEDPSPHLWLPLSQWYDSDVVVHVRSTGDPRALLPALRQRVAELDPDLPVLRADLMENVTANATLPQRILSLIMGIAGAVALALAVLGIYGVVSFSVSQRTREVGLRMALGAEPRRVIRMVVREGFGVALVGLVPGLLLSLVAAQLLRAFLLGADPMNPLVFSVGMGLLSLSVVAASLAPALRASRAHPMESLRSD